MMNDMRTATATYDDSVLIEHINDVDNVILFTVTDADDDTTTYAAYRDNDDIVIYYADVATTLTMSIDDADLSMIDDNVRDAILAL